MFIADRWEIPPVLTFSTRIFGKNFSLLLETFCYNIGASEREKEKVMGCSYSVKIEGWVSNEEALYKELRQFVEKSHPRFAEDLFYQSIDFSLEEYAENGATVDSLEGVLRIVFGGRKGQYCFNSDVDENLFTDELETEISFNSDFTATYSWCRVIKWAFEIIASHMETCRHLNSESDTGWTIEDGEVKGRAA